MKHFLKDIELFIFVLAILTNELLVRVFCKLTIFNSSILLEIFFCLCIYFVFSLFKTKIKNILLVITLIIYTFYSFGQTMHYAFFKSFFSLSKLSVISELKDVLGEVLTKLEFKYLLFLLPLILFIFFINKYKEEINYKLPNKILFSITFIAMLLIVRWSYFNKYEIEDENSLIDITTDAYLYNNLNSDLKFYNKFGSFEYLLKDIERLDEKESLISVDEIFKITNFILKNKGSRSVLEGTYKGKNLILILCESLCPEAIDKDLTPTLYKLANEGTYFTNYYAPLYPSNTCDSEFISQTGQIPSIDYGTTSKIFGDNYYPYALANLFKNAGYGVKSFHSNTKEFYNREVLHNSFGFEYLYDLDDLGLEFNGEEYNNWIDDARLFEKVVENTDTSKPFYDFIISASGHFPYYSGREEIIDNYEVARSLYPNVPKQVCYYYAAQMKLDEGLEILINDLKKNNLLDDTVIILFGDHYPYGIDHEDTYDYFFGDLENSYDIYKTPLIIYDSLKEGQVNNTLASTFDIFPTITSLFDLDDLGAYTVGEDLFVEDDERFVLFPDYSVLANNFYYDSLSSTMIGKDTNGILELAHQHYKYSQEILSSDYYSLIKKKKR